MSSSTIQTDAVLIGCGIMSATLGVMLKELDPKLKIHIIERLDEVAGESSDAWNNAGTGHAALCELNYTPEKDDGSIDISKALQVDEEFELSKQFWAWLARQKRIDPTRFIHSLPHMSFVVGKANQEFLRKRHAAMNAHPLFHGMEFTTDRQQIGEWAPLLMKDRQDSEVYAATRSLLERTSTSVHSRMLFADLMRCLTRSCTRGAKCATSTAWMMAVGVRVRRTPRVANTVNTTRISSLSAQVVVLPLLEKSNIPEAGATAASRERAFAALPQPAIIKQHNAAVYGKARR